MLSALNWLDSRCNTLATACIYYSCHLKHCQTFHLNCCSVLTMHAEPCCWHCFVEWPYIAEPRHSFGSKWRFISCLTLMEFHQLEHHWVSWAINSSMLCSNPRFKFKALELNRKLLEGAEHLKKPAVKEPTVPEGFELQIEKRLQERQISKNSEEEERPQTFKSQPLPKRILEGVVVSWNLLLTLQCQIQVSH